MFLPLQGAQEDQFVGSSPNVLPSNTLVVFECIAVLHLSAMFFFISLEFEEGVANWTAAGWRRGGRERDVVARLVGGFDEEEQRGSRPQQAALPDAAARCPCHLLLCC